MAHSIGIDVNDFPALTRNEIRRAIKRDPSVIIIRGARMTQEELECIALAYQSGHQVRLVHSDTNINDIEWLTPIPSGY